MADGVSMASGSRTEMVNEEGILLDSNNETMKELEFSINGKLIKISIDIEDIYQLPIYEKNQKNIKKALEQTKTELRRVKKGKKAYEGYNVPVVDNILIDEKNRVLTYFFL